MDFNLQDALALLYFGLACVAFGLIVFAVVRRSRDPSKSQAFATSGPIIASWLLIACANIVFLFTRADRGPAWGTAAAVVVVLACFFNAAIALAKRRRIARDGALAR